MPSKDIQIAVSTRYLEEQSRPEANRYAFAYTIEITNTQIIGYKGLTRTLIQNRMATLQNFDAVFPVDFWHHKVLNICEVRHGRQHV